MLFSEWAFRLMFVRDGLMFVRDLDKLLAFGSVQMNLHCTLLFAFCNPDAVSISIFNTLYRIKIGFDFHFASLPRQEAEC